MIAQRRSAVFLNHNRTSLHHAYVMNGRRLAVILGSRFDEILNNIICKSIL